MLLFGAVGSAATLSIASRMSLAFAGCIRARSFPASRAMTICTLLCSHNANGPASSDRQRRRPQPHNGGARRARAVHRGRALPPGAFASDIGSNCSVHPCYDDRIRRPRIGLAGIAKTWGNYKVTSTLQAPLRRPLSGNRAGWACVVRAWSEQLQWGKSSQTSTIRKGTLAPIPARRLPGTGRRDDHRVSARAAALRPIRVRAVLGRRRGARPAAEPAHGDATAGQDRGAGDKTLRDASSRATKASIRRCRCAI